MSVAGFVWSTLWRWVPPILWMAIITAGSTDSLAADETSRFVVPFLRWLFPLAAPATVELMHEAIRKLGHVTEFAILALLWYRGLAWEMERRCPAAVWTAFMLSVVFAFLDEAHQALVITRNGSVWDVGWDTLGALAGVFTGSRIWRRM
jgi:VanZ family protein